MKALQIDFFLAYRNIVGQKRRSAIAVGATAFGIIALILATGFVEWIFWGMREGTIDSQLGHIQISRPGYQEAGKADPYTYLLPDVIPELESGNERRQIKAVVPRLSFGGLISHGDTTLSFIGDGVTPQEQVFFGKSLQILAGQNLSVDDPKGIILGAGLGHNLNVNIGDKVVLLASTASRGVNAVEVTVRGLFSTVNKSYDDIALRIPIETARKLLRVEGSHIWVVLLNDTEKTDTVLQRLHESLQKSDFEAVPWYLLADFYSKTVALFTKQIHGLKLIIALIIILTISNAMTMSVMGRIGEIGTDMALGARRIDVLRRFLSEGILLGGVGGLMGVTIGVGLAAVISSIGIPMPPPPGMARGYTGEILVTWNIAFESFLLAVGTTLIASIYPAWKASRMQIVDALRHNR